MKINLQPETQTLSLTIAGDVLSTNADVIRSEINRLLEAGDSPTDWKKFKLDLTAAKMVDSVGLNLIVNLLKRLQARGATLQVIYSSQNLLRTFVFTRLDKCIELVKA